MTATTDRSTSTTDTTESTRPFRGRRLSRAQFYTLRPDRRPVNENRLATCRVKPPTSIPVLTKSIAEVSDEQAAERAGSSTDKGSFAALHYSADESASSCSNTNIAFGRSASG